MAPPPLRPLQIGEILDASVKVYVKNARTLIGLAAVVVVPIQILSAAILLNTVSSGSEVPTSLPKFGLGSAGTVHSIDSTASIGSRFTVEILGALANLLVTAVFCVFLYDVPFEVLAGGRTPGKRLNHLRVVRDGGGPVNPTASIIRNLMRLIDFLPSAYLVGVTSILISKSNRRLGDIAGGTLVIRDVRGPRDAVGAPAAQPRVPRVDSGGWDVSAVSSEETIAVRRFLQRRSTLDRRPRQALAHRLEQGLRAKVSGAPEGLDAERFLEELARVKASR